MSKGSHRRGGSSLDPIRKPSELSNLQLSIAFNFFATESSQDHLVGQIHGDWVYLLRKDVIWYMSQPPSSSAIGSPPATQGPMTVTPVRGGKMTAPEVTKPECPEHMSEMQYDSDRGVWVCTNFQCKQIARRKLTINDVGGTVIAGDYQLYAVGDEENATFYIYIKQINAFLDLSKFLSRDTTGDVHGKTEAFHIGLEFPRLNRSSLQD